MLDVVTHLYLRMLLIGRPKQYPQRMMGPFSAGFQPEHLKCHLTSLQAAVEFGELPVVGIEFLDLNGKLYPWPHMVNLKNGSLVDYSPKPAQPSLGFIETGWSEFDQWRAVIAAYQDRDSFAPLPFWGDPLADELSNEFFPQLRASAR